MDELLKIGSQLLQNLATKNKLNVGLYNRSGFLILLAKWHSSNADVYNSIWALYCLYNYAFTFWLIFRITALDLLRYCVIIFSCVKFLINKSVCLCKQSDAVASCCVWWRERPNGTGPPRARRCHVARTGSSAPVGRTQAPCQPTHNPPETATVGDLRGGAGSEGVRRKKMQRENRKAERKNSSYP